MDWLAVYLWGADFTGVLPRAPWDAPLPAGDLDGESWTDHDPDIVQLVYEVLVDQSACGRCGAPLRRAVSTRLIAGTSTAPRFVVTARCRNWRRHRSVADVAHRRGGLRFGELHPA